MKVYPKWMLSIAESAADKHPSDIQKAAEVAERAIRKHPEFEAVVATLVSDAVREMVYEVRHTTNVRLRKEAGEYGGPAKVVTGDSKAYQEVMESMYSYRIDGRTLGTILGKELGPIAVEKRAVGDGCYLVARLCERLEKIVPADKMVMEAVAEKRLRAMYRKLQETVGKKVA